MQMNSKARKLYEGIMKNMPATIDKALNEISDEALIMAAGVAKHRANNAKTHTEKEFEMNRANRFLNYARDEHRYDRNDNQENDFFKILGSDSKEIRKADSNQINGGNEPELTPEFIIMIAMRSGQQITVQNKNQLKGLIGTAIEMFGPTADLSFIDTSEITDMSELFANQTFNGNISKWDVSNVTDMQLMFAGSTFNGNISRWKTGNVVNMRAMFAASQFNGDISKWNTRKVTNMSKMFEESLFDQPIGNWNTGRVENMSGMFKNAVFDQDISGWNVSSVRDFSEMFWHSSFTGDISKWTMQRSAKKRHMLNIGFNGIA